RLPADERWISLMRKSKVLAKLRSGNAARICSMGHFLPFYVRYAAHFRYDAIWLDLEHRAMTDREVQSLLTLCHLSDIDCMVRPPSTERNRLYRYLEDGAAGFLIPFASDAETARRVVEATKFPPLGNRGLDGVGLDGDFGVQGWRKKNADYTLDANRETFVIAQIETPEAVSKVDEIVAVDGIDGLFVGSGDLGLRLALRENATDGDLDSAIQRVAEASTWHGKAWGAASGSLEAIAKYWRMGARVITWGGDYGLRKVLEDCSVQLDSSLCDESDPV
ncbi:MAG: HpcH/HpaI aldolase family protein, partial [Terriglobia bacterium]